MENHTLSVPLDDIQELLWHAVAGSRLDLDRLRNQLTPQSQFQDEGIDSLDLVEFFVRIQDRYKIAIPQEEYAELTTLDAVRSYVATRLRVATQEERT
jgi:acyl carrier protein